MFLMDIKLDNGKVYCLIEGLSGCCGIVLIYYIRFYPTTPSRILKLYKDFHEYLTATWGSASYKDTDNSGDTKPRELHRCKLLISDAMYGEEEDMRWYPAQFCRKMGWDEIGTPCLNPSSNNKVIMFEWNRP